MGRLKTYLKNVAILTITGLGLRAAGMFFRVYIAARASGPRAWACIS